VYIPKYEPLFQMYHVIFRQWLNMRHISNVYQEWTGLDTSNTHSVLTAGCFVVCVEWQYISDVSAFQISSRITFKTIYPRHLFDNRNHGGFSPTQQLIYWVSFQHVTAQWAIISSVRMED